MNRTRPPTGSDVARLAGVSKSAVSRAYNGGYVAPEVRTRIFDAARKLRYRPSIAARALTTNRSNLIGLVITSLDNQFYPELVDRLNGRLSLDGYRCVLFETHGDAQLEPMLDELLGFRLDGVIMASTSFGTRVATECADAGVPVIMLNNVDLSGQVAGVCVDNRHGATEIANHFVALKTRRTAVINGFEESSASVERTRHFRDAVLAAGLPDPQVVSGDYSFEGACAATRALLSRADPVEAIFCVTDFMALACLQEARKIGRIPGRDVAIAGFDDVTVAGWPAFDLTTYAVPVDALIDSCVTRLISAIDGQPLDSRLSRIAGQLVIRGSSGILPR